MPRKNRQADRRDAHRGSRAADGAYVAMAGDGGELPPPEAGYFQGAVEWAKESTLNLSAMPLKSVISYAY
jgi:hypothetical protein